MLDADDGLSGTELVSGTACVVVVVVVLEGDSLLLLLLLLTTLAPLLFSTGAHSVSVLVE